MIASIFFDVVSITSKEVISDPPQTPIASALTTRVDLLDFEPDLGVYLSLTPISSIFDSALNSTLATPNIASFVLDGYNIFCTEYVPPLIGVITKTPVGLGGVIPAGTSMIDS